MADTISLKLKGVATSDIFGDNTQSTLERENTIEVLSFSSAVRTAFERSSGMATGRRFYEPIRFTKRIDKASPRLRQALVTNDTVSGTFRWFRPNPAAAGTTQHFLTLEFSAARIVSVNTMLPDTTQPATAALPPMDEVELVAGHMAWTFVPGGITHQDDWIAAR